MLGEYCPKCLIGTIVRKNGKYGEFLACDRYPYCYFIDKIKKDELSEKGKLEAEADELLRKSGREDLIL